MFGPVVAIATYDDLDDAFDLANDSAFGLQAAIFTADISKALRAIHTLDYGGVLVNEVPTWRADQQPYGGLRDSGNTREGPAYSVKEMTEIRMVVLGGMMRWGVFGGSSRIYKSSLKPAFDQLGHVVVDAPSRNGDDFAPYDEMLARADIDAVYNPLPNHLHASGATGARRRQARAVREAADADPVGERGAVRPRRVRGAHHPRGVHVAAPPTGAYVARAGRRWLARQAAVRSGVVQLPDGHELRAITASTHAGPALCSTSASTASPHSC